MSFRLLSNYVEWNNLKSVKKLIKICDDKNEVINILNYDGVLFDLAIKNKNPEIIKVLIEYYEDKFLKPLELGSPDYNRRLVNLQKAITQSVDETEEEVSEEVIKSFGDYYEAEEDVESFADFCEKDEEGFLAILEATDLPPAPTDDTDCVALVGVVSH